MDTLWTILLLVFVLGVIICSLLLYNHYKRKKNQNSLMNHNPTPSTIFNKINTSPSSVIGNQTPPSLVTDKVNYLEGMDFDDMKKHKRGEYRLGKAVSFERYQLANCPLENIWVYVYNQTRVFALKDKQRESIEQWRSTKVSNMFRVYCNDKNVFVWGTKAYHALVYIPSDMTFDKNTEPIPEQPKPYQINGVIDEEQLYVYPYDKQLPKPFDNHIYIVYNSMATMIGEEKLAASLQHMDETKYIIVVSSLSPSYDVYENTYTISMYNKAMEERCRHRYNYIKQWKNNAVNGPDMKEPDWQKAFLFIQEPNKYPIDSSNQYIQDGVLRLPLIPTSCLYYPAHYKTVSKALVYPYPNGEFMRLGEPYFRLDTGTEVLDSSNTGTVMYDDSSRSSEMPVMLYFDPVPVSGSIEPMKRRGSIGNERKLSIGTLMRVEPTRRRGYAATKVPEPIQQDKLIVQQDDWLQNIVGMHETDWTSSIEGNGNKGYWSLHDDNTLGIINQSDKTIVYNAGKLHYVSIGQLKDEVILNKKGDIQPIRLFSGNKHADITKILNKPENRGHMFQAASQFDGLECGVDNMPSKDHTFFHGYAHDSTQGPFVSLIAPAAAISRRDYVYPYNLNPSQIIQGQSVNYLDELKDLFFVENGYIKRNDKSKVLNEVDFENKMNKVKVIFNENATVYYDLSEKYMKRILKKVEEPFPVHQVFTAAMNIDQGKSGYNNRTQDDFPNLLVKLNFLLEAAYTSAYLAAHKCQAPVLWLTLVGGGVFGNFVDLIFQNIHKVHQQYGKGIQVHLVDYDKYAMVNEKSGIDGLFECNPETIPETKMSQYYQNK